MRVHVIASLATALLCAFPAASAELAKPTGKVVLEVTGLIANSNNGAVADFDDAMLEALDKRETQTATPWYDGIRKFEGPLGRSLLDAVGAGGTQIRVTALNDYVTIIPISDFTDFDVILATRIDDAPLSVRDKGPVFVIYPFDQQPTLNNETYYGRSAWQVKSIEVF